MIHCYYSASQAAEIIITAMVKERFHIRVGSDVKLMNFLFRLSPKFATDSITKQMGSLLGNSYRARITKTALLRASTQLNNDNQTSTNPAFLY